MYTKQMVKNWWLQLLRGVLIALLGLLVMFKPLQIAVTFVVLFGAFGVINSVISLISMVSGTRHNPLWWLELIFGLLSLGVGLLILRWPEITLYFIVQLFSIIILISGIFNLLSALQLRKRMEHEWLLLATGIFKIVFALVLVLLPETGIATVLWMIGLLTIVLGVSEAVNGYRVRSLANILEL